MFDNLSAEEIIEELKIIYFDIFQGYSFFPVLNIYLKHFNELDNIKNIIAKKNLIKEYSKQGLYTNEERKKYLLENGFWTQEKDDRILQLNFIISDNEKQINQLFVQGQKDAIQKLVDKDKEELKKLKEDLEKIMEPTCETMAAKSYENNLLYNLCFKDKNLLIPYWTTEDFDLLEENELIKYKILLRVSLEKTNSNYIRYIACLPFFLNSLQFSEKKVMDFFPISNVSSLSYAQSELFSCGLRNLNVLKNIEVSPPTLTDVSIEELAKWYDLQYSILLGKTKNNS